MNNPSVHSVVYQIDGQEYESRLFVGGEGSAPRPGLVMAPNWMGVTAGAEEIAHAVAGRGYVVLLADLYGRTVRPDGPEQAGAAMMPLKQDRALLRARMQAALDQLIAQEGVPLDKQRLAAFGFCFGGCCALELARAGAPLAAAISFHGTLDTPVAADAQRIQGKVLVLHGASDPLVPREQLPAFEEEMNAAKVDWQLVSYGGVVHSFTDRHASVPGKTEYNATVAKRAFKAMHDLLDEAFGN